MDDMRHGTNWFGYVRNAPTVLDDPRGLQEKDDEKGPPWYHWLWPPHWSWWPKWPTRPSPPRQGPGLPESPHLPPWTPDIPPQPIHPGLCDPHLFCGVTYVAAVRTYCELIVMPGDEWTEDDVHRWNSARKDIMACTNVDIGEAPIGPIAKVK